MANKKVSELTSYSSVLSTDYIVIDRPTGTANTQLSAVAAYILSLPLTATTLIDNSVTNLKLADNSVSTSEISSRSVTTDKIALNAVTSAELADNSVTNLKLADNSVSTLKLANSCITPAKLSASIVNPYGGLKIDSVSGLSVETKIHPDITTNSTLGLSASNRIVGLNSATAITITVPSDSSINFDIGTNIVIYQKGAGQVTLSAAGGVTLLSNSSKVKLTGQYSSAALFKLASNSWLLGGDLTT